MTRDDPLTPSAAVLCKLGSVLVHAEEMIGPGGHDLDRVALEAVLADPELAAWREGMDAMALLPKPRSPRGSK